MTTTSNPSGEHAASPERSTSAETTTATKPAKSAATSSTQPKTRVELVQHYAERAILVPVGASLLARENLVSTVAKYTSRAGLEKELKRYERRGVTARNRFERQVRRTRTKFERELRQRRTRVERTVKQNRRRVEREVRSVRRDLEKQSGAVGARFEKLVANAQELLSTAP
jgi:hypothetical protein